MGLLLTIDELILLMKTNSSLSATNSKSIKILEEYPSTFGV